MDMLLARFVPHLLGVKKSSYIHTLHFYMYKKSLENSFFVTAKNRNYTQVTYVRKSS